MTHEPASTWRAQTPLITVCIPAFMAEKYLEHTLRSVAMQTVTDWELIVTEDGSRDGTEEIVRAFAATVRQPVSYLRHETNRGLPATRNTGIAAARGTWVAFLDADDLWRPEHLEALVDAARKVTVDLVFAGTEWFEDGTGRIVARSIPSDEDLRQLPVALFTGRLSVLPSSVMIRRRCFERFGFVSTDYPYVNDTEYWLRILRHGGNLAYSGQLTCLYRQHGQAMSKKAAAMLADSAQLCEQYADWAEIPSPLKRRRPASLYRWAGRTAMNDNPRQAVHFFTQSLRLEPLNPKTLGLLARTVINRLERRAAPQN